ncbi:MAG: type II toxin-antitoxin system RelB/DinJ family antitoxin [bacterium]|jgi:addiction module RelB/DinJ family antitoxin
MKTVISLKIDKELKNQASKLAEEMGFNLSSIIAATLRSFVVNREINISLKHRMTPYLEGIIRKVRQEGPNEGSPTFDNAEDAISWLNKKIGKKKS